jgi:hypothetical protein
MTAIPDHHAGLIFFNFLAKLIRLREATTYLEIGVFEGETLSHILVDKAVGVDPEFKIRYNVANGKRELTLHQRTSDSFFKSDEIEELKGKLDIAFLDGMHLFEFLLRDFYNTESISHQNSLIAIHDCLPLKPFMMLRDRADSEKEREGDSHEGWWTGDVWKIIPILKEYRPDLTITIVDSAPTGLVLISNLSPSSSLLKDNYLEIVAKYKSFPNDVQSLTDLYSLNDVVRTGDIINGYDHSLFFRL